MRSSGSSTRRPLHDDQGSDPIANGVDFGDLAVLASRYDHAYARRGLGIVDATRPASGKKGDILFFWKGGAKADSDLAG